MKKTVLPLAGLVALASVSFVQQQDGGFKKVSNNMYETKGFAKMAKEDQQKLVEKLQNEYNIKSFNGEISFEFKKITDPKNPKNSVSYMADKKVNSGFFNHSMLDNGEKDEVMVACIYVACPPPPPPKKDYIQTLTPVSGPTLHEVKTLLTKYN